MFVMDREPLGTSRGPWQLPLPLTLSRRERELVAGCATQGARSSASADRDRQTVGRCFAPTREANLRLRACVSGVNKLYLEASAERPRPAPVEAAPRPMGVGLASPAKASGTETTTAARLTGDYERRHPEDQGPGSPLFRPART